jgi:hypothetical protein
MQSVHDPHARLGRVRLLRGLAALSALAFVFAAATVEPARADSQLPLDRSALLLYKCVPYVQTWAGVDTLRLQIVTSSPRDGGRAEELASYLREISDHARRQDPKAPLLRSATCTLASLSESHFRGRAPHVIFLIAGDAVPAAPSLSALRGLASRHGFLIVTDQLELMEETAALGFVLSGENRPEIVLDVERARAQGAQLSAGLVRLARPRGGRP